MDRNDRIATHTPSVYEDAVLHAAAQNVRADCIVTRNVRDFRLATLKVYAPDELLAVMDYG